MTVAAHVVLAAAELEDDELVATRLLDDFAGDLGARDERLTDRHAATVTRRNEKNLVEDDLRPGVALELLDRDGLARFDSILLSTRLNDGVHDLKLRGKMLSESRTLLIARRSSSLSRSAPRSRVRSRAWRDAKN
jgi:hypothetical protein